MLVRIFKTFFFLVTNNIVFIISSFQPPRRQPDNREQVQQNGSDFLCFLDECVYFLTNLEPILQIKKKIKNEAIFFRKKNGM